MLQPIQFWECAESFMRGSFAKVLVSLAVTRRCVHWLAVVHGLLIISLHLLPRWRLQQKPTKVAVVGGSALLDAATSSCGDFCDLKNPYGATGWTLRLV